MKIAPQDQLYEPKVKIITNIQKGFVDYIQCQISV